VHQGFGGRDVAELEFGLGRHGNPADGAAHAARGVKGIATRAARAAHAGPRVAAHKMASPAVYTCSFSWKAALGPGAAMVAILAVHVPCGKVSKAFLLIFEPNR
jgi:hypothetical protein